MWPASVRSFGQSKWFQNLWPRDKRSIHVRRCQNHVIPVELAEQSIPPTPTAIIKLDVLLICSNRKIELKLNEAIETAPIVSSTTYFLRTSDSIWSESATIRRSGWEVVPFYDGRLIKLEQNRFTAWCNRATVATSVCLPLVRSGDILWAIIAAR